MKTLFNLYQIKNQDQTNFAFNLPNQFQDPNNYAKQYFIKYLNEYYPELTVTGLETDSDNDTNGLGIQYAWPGSIISVNAENKYDVDWFGTEEAAERYGVRTNLNLIDDWSTITNNLRKYAEKYQVFKNSTGLFDFSMPQQKSQTYNINLSDGTKVEVFPAFIKIGTDIIPRFVSKKQVTMPKGVVKKYANVLNEITEIIVKY